MNFEFRKYNDSLKSVWQELNLKSNNSTFLTNIFWTEFQTKLGKETDKYVVYFDEEPVALIFIEIYRRTTSKYAYLPRGPIFNLEGDYPTTIVQDFFIALKNFAQTYIKEKNLNLFRIDPLINFSFKEILEASGWFKSLALGQVQYTWKTNLKSSENDPSLTTEELLKLQKKDTRYYIKRAVKKGVKVVKATEIKEVKEFVKLMNQTKERNSFWGYSDEYYINQWKYLNKNGKNFIGNDASICEIFLCKYKGKYISGALINYSVKQAHYAHGASSSDPEFAALASPYLLLWSCIEDAQKNGYEYFDFWGVIPKGIEHEWRGLSDFKMKFYGFYEEYTGTYEVGTSNINYLINKAFDWWNYRKLRIGKKAEVRGES